MARPPIQSRLPALSVQTGEFDPHQSKASQIALRLRAIILENQSTRSTVFYPLREIADTFQVSLRTANLALKILEREDLLVSVRGSHSRIPGRKEWGTQPARAVVGLPLWMFGIRYSLIHRYLPLELGKRLWEQNLALTTVPFSEVADQRSDFDTNLSKHRMDFAVWLFPFAHNRNTILHLNDRGTGNLIIQHSSDPRVLPPDLVVQHNSAYAQVLRCWKHTHRIQHILIPRGNEYARGRGPAFARLAGEFGLTCEELPCTPELPGRLGSSRQSRAQHVGIALLDEPATAEFCHFDPPAFTRILRRHRVLFGNNTINLPFIPDLQFDAERIFIKPEPLARGIALQFSRRLSGGKPARPLEIRAEFNPAWPLHRYV